MDIVITFTGVASLSIDPKSPTMDQHSGVNEVAELVIIGAGPHALTLMLRLLEQEPDLMPEKKRATLSMDEAAINTNIGSWPYIKGRVAGGVMKGRSTTSQISKRYLEKKAAAARAATVASSSTGSLAGGKKKASKGAKRRNRSAGSAYGGVGDANGGWYDRHQSTPAVPHEMVQDGRIKVIDKFGDWLHAWNSNFDAYEIQHLRSAADVHPGPHDMRELLAFAHKTHRNLNDYDLVYMNHMQRKTSSFKSQANDPTVYRGPYVMPSTKLFKDYNNLLIRAYGLEDVVQKNVVTSVEILSSGQRDGIETEQGKAAESSSNLYRLELDDGSHIDSKRIVCALGPNLRRDRMDWAPPPRTYPSDRLVHAFEMADWLKTVKDDPIGWSRYKRIVIVGGGITAAHVMRVALKHNVSDIHFLVRSEIRTRQFDIAESWMGPSRGDKLDSFFNLPMNQRAQSIAAARSGGSMPPEYVATVKQAQEDGFVTLHESTDISAISWIHTGSNDGHWEVSVDAPGPPMECDVILAAVGADLDIEQHAILRDMLRQKPIDMYNGFPALTSSLAWSSTDEFYMMGALAALQLGPDALNLAGARHGACRLAVTLRKELAAAACDESSHQSHNANADEDTEEPVHITLERLGITPFHSAEPVSHREINALSPKSSQMILDSLKVWYINLDGRNDRRSRMDNLISTHGLTTITERFPAIDTENALVAQLLDWQDDNSGLSDKEFACALSHFGVWEKIAALPEGSYGLVLEDDVVFLKGWLSELADVVQQKLPQDWELFYLDCMPTTGWQFGRKISSGNAGQFESSIQGPVEGCTFADAYVLKPSAARSLLAMRPENPLANAESLLLDLQSRSKAYTSIPRLALQIWDYSDIQTSARVAAMEHFYSNTYHRWYPRDLYEYDQ